MRNASAGDADARTMPIPRAIDRFASLGAALVTALGAALTLAGCAMVTSPAGSAASGRTYLMSAFTATAQNTLSLFTSSDGVSFTSLGSEVYTPPQGLLRDPSILRADDGRYYIVYTTGWSGQTFGVARSADLRHWQHVADIAVALPGVRNVWAPEWFRDRDGRISVIVSLSTAGTDGPFGSYVLTPEASDFSAFSAPQPMRGLEANHIDTFVLRQGERYLAFTKNETSKFIERAWAPALSGPWTIDRSGDWAGWGGPSEGQALAPVRR
ncbi:MAG: family 43 glycosylhydrolase, partial [Burkholderiales bacterium]|nr:family 43 glycosylhydrolase [Burkholderiales bacterium]